MVPKPHHLQHLKNLHHLEVPKLHLHEKSAEIKEPRVNWITIRKMMVINRPRMTGKGKSKGKKSKKKPSQDSSPHPGTSQGANTVPRTNFTSKNLGTGRPTIQCTACGEYTHWRRECPYDNYCTTCNNHDHATHMCRACRQATRNQQSPPICVYCGSAEHSSATCHKRPWDNREQLHGTSNTLGNQQHQSSNTEILGNAPGDATSSGTNTHGHSSQSQFQ